MRKLLFQSLVQMSLTEPAPPADDTALAEVGAALASVARRSLGRSLSIREVDAGSCNGCELEIHALANAYYDLERFGLRFVASPRHADGLPRTNGRCASARRATACPMASSSAGAGCGAWSPAAGIVTLSWSTDCCISE